MLPPSGALPVECAFLCACRALPVPGPCPHTSVGREDEHLSSSQGNGGQASCPEVWEPAGMLWDPEDSACECPAR